MIMNSNSVEKKLTKKDLKQVFVRSIAYNSSFNYERQLNLGWAFSLMPVLRKLYKDDEEQMKAALLVIWSLTILPHLSVQYYLV